MYKIIYKSPKQLQILNQYKQLDRRKMDWTHLQEVSGDGQWSGMYTHDIYESGIEIQEEVKSNI